MQAVSKNKNAIGYVGIGYLNKEVKALKVENIAGSAETTLNGTYPISRPLFMFTPGWPKGDTLNFINFVLHPQKGQRYVTEAGFVPLYSIIRKEAAGVLEGSSSLMIPKDVTPVKTGVQGCAAMIPGSIFDPVRPMADRCLQVSNCTERIPLQWKASPSHSCSSSSSWPWCSTF